ncbi:MAG: CoA transferase [Deltaproteobacteria bacterium]|nr:MAG: CoA transferase [Deltaproteobacteria bacterium]
MAGPLSGIRVVDLSRVLAGPFCTMILGDLGADVIKVERPGAGDDTREWGPPFAAGESAYYLCVNRNKRSVALDLKTEEGAGIARDLAAASDVVVENFRVGAAAKMGLGYEELKGRNPRIVYCSISGYGQTGPYREVPGYDFIIQAMSGLMSITGESGGEPMKLGVATVDLTTGLYAAVAILAALRERDRSGLGQRIDLSLMDSAISWLANVGSNYLVSGEVGGRYGNAHANIVPYQVFRAKDRRIAVGIGNDGQWRKFCEIAGARELASDPRFATNPGRVKNRGELIPLLEKIFPGRDSSFWIENLWREGIPAGPIHCVDAVFADPHAAAREMIVEMDHPAAGKVRLIGSPMKFSGTPVEYRLPPPLLGEHTAAVLKERIGAE